MRNKYKYTSFQGFTGDFKQYKTDCIPGEQCRHCVSKISETSLGLIEIPKSQSQLIQLLYSNATNHSGLQALRISFENGRSPQSIYIVILFDGKRDSYIVSFKV